MRKTARKQNRQPIPKPAVCLQSIQNKNRCVTFLFSFQKIPFIFMLRSFIILARQQTNGTVCNRAAAPIRLSEAHLRK